MRATQEEAAKARARIVKTAGRIFADGLESLAGVLTDAIPDAGEKREKALTVPAMLAGALVLAVEGRRNF